MSEASVLLLDAAPDAARELGERLRGHGVKTQTLPVTKARGSLPNVDIAVVVLQPSLPIDQATTVRALLARLATQGLATIVWGVSEKLRPLGGPRIESLSADVPLDEVVGKIGTLARYAPLVKGLERELEHLHRIGLQLNRHFGELDQELRLAGRLQRDFLPRSMPNVPPYRFEVLYRPATWVSGDMYDVFRIDEHHFGVFIADAMGHGVAAGLLTMFLRQALSAKRISGSSYTIVRPEEALENLHDCLVRQHLPNCQFVTAAYAIVNAQTGEVRMARAGHPYALHISPDAEIEEIVSSGSLLGLPDVPGEFAETSVQVSPGDKLVFYTDGMEDSVVIPRAQSPDHTEFTAEMKSWARMDATAMVAAVNHHLDYAEGSLNPADDVTMLVIERD
jgi:serine phosphatase RsbU (regulator of sigma subunit)